MKGAIRRSLGIMTLIVVLLSGAFISGAALADDVSTDTLEELVGWTVVAITRYDGTFEGADYDKYISLENRWAFRFQSYRYAYRYRPDVVVFATVVNNAAIYRLVIDDEIYNVIRVR